MAYIAKWIGPPVKIVSPTIGISESSGRPIVRRRHAFVRPDGTITSERMKPVRPRAKRLITTPETIWLIWYLIDNTACSAASKPPARMATRIDEPKPDGCSPRPEHGVDHVADACRAEHHALDADVDDPRTFAPQPGHRAERDRRREQQRFVEQVGHVRDGRIRQGQADGRGPAGSARAAAISWATSDAVESSGQEAETPTST